MNDQQLVALFEGLDTPGVSDAMDKLGIPGQCLGIAPLDNYRGTVVGPAFTVQYVPANTPPGSVGDFIEDVLPGDVVVIANAGRTDCTVWGDIMTQYAGARGIAATVIDGVCRDVSKALGDGYPMFTRGRYMRTGKDRVQVQAYEEPVTLGDVRVCPGDLLVGDADGVVVVPRARMEEVLAKAMETRALESRILDAALGGMPLTEARKQFGYHTLQRSPDKLA